MTTRRIGACSTDQAARRAVEQTLEEVDSRDARVPVGPLFDVTALNGSAVPLARRLKTLEGATHLPPSCEVG